MVRARGVIDGVTPREDRDVSSGMPIIGRDKLDRAVVIVMVVPRHEGICPGVRVFDGRKGLCRKGRAVLERTKEGFGVRVVIAYAWSTEGRDDAESLQGREHGRAFYRPPVSGVEHEPGARYRLLAIDGREQRRRMRVALRRLHCPAHDAAVPDFQDQLEIPEHAPHGALEVRDDLTPHLLRSRGMMGGHLASHGRLFPATMRELSCVPQQAVDRRFGRHEHALIGESRHDLVW